MDEEYDLFPEGMEPVDFGCHGYFETWCGTTAENCVKCWQGIKERQKDEKLCTKVFTNG